MIKKNTVLQVLTTISKFEKIDPEKLIKEDVVRVNNKKATLETECYEGDQIAYRLDGTQFFFVIMGP
jgi:hypothetical protein